MTNLKYDLIIVGGGPIGSVVAYFSSLNKQKLEIDKIALIQMEPLSYAGVAYPYAGGSIRWYFYDEEIKENTKKTADFVLSLKERGVNLNLLEDNYFFVHRGLFVPSLNISGAKLVSFFKKEAESNGVKIYSETEFEKLDKVGKLYKIVTNKGEFLTNKVVFAMGFKNKEHFHLDIDVEKRQLFVLDLEVTPERLTLPHTVFKFKEGVVYYFLKKFDDGYKIILGQEDVYEHNLDPIAEDYFNHLLEIGLIDILPFLRETRVEKILWGFDVKNKKPLIYEYDNNVFIINCGSAIRSIIGIAEKVLEKLSS
ncbi:MAG: FAD-dependent oxidoreductase [Candidatus Aenigmatarchaeota archaeon]